MRYSPEQAENLAAFTYFKDEHGLIYYAYGDNSLDHETIRSVLVYTPAEDGCGNRYQPSSDTPYNKVLSHGYQSELPRLRENLSPEQYHIVAAMCERDSVRGDEFLAVPSSGVTEVYDPKNAFQRLYTGSHPAYSNAVSERLREATGIFEGQSIGRERLGLYGGLQCSLTHADGKEINDIDLLVDGLDAYDAVVGLSAGNMVFPDTFPDFLATHAIKRAVAIRRAQLSQFRLSQHPDTTVDVRIVRTTRDSNDTATQLAGLTPQSTITLTEALVVNARESLSLPVRYVVQSPEGYQWSVATEQYHHLGAATKGDVVSIHGSVGDAGTVLLTDPNRHYIYIPTLS